MLALAMSFGCGEEAPLGGIRSKDEQQDAGADSRRGSEPQTSSPGDSRSNDVGETSPVPSSETTADRSFVVDEDERELVTTQVYNGRTHAVENVSATLRAAGDGVSVYVQETFNSHVTDSQLNAFMSRLLLVGSAKSYLGGAGILPTSEAVFGPLDRANLPGATQRVFVVDTSGAGDGYLCGWCEHPDLHLDGTLVAPLDGEKALSITAHELFHAIHRGYDTDEEVWMDESLAEAAMTINGYFTDQTWLGDFVNNPNKDWGPGGADVTTVHYGACLAWGTYLWEQGGVDLMQALTAEAKNGWDGLEAAVASINDPRSAWELYLGLGAALYFDDPARGFGFESFDLPVALRGVALTDGTTVESLEPYGLLYYEVRAGTRLTVDGNEVTATYIAHETSLELQILAPSVAFEVEVPGVLMITGRSRTSVSVVVEER